MSCGGLADGYAATGRTVGSDRAGLHRSLWWRVLRRAVRVRADAQARHAHTLRHARTRAQKLTAPPTRMQAEALALVAAKLRASLAVEGELPADGLAALEGDGADVVLAWRGTRQNPRPPPRRGRWRPCSPRPANSGPPTTRCWSRTAGTTAYPRTVLRHRSPPTQASARCGPSMAPANSQTCRSLRRHPLLHRRSRPSAAQSGGCSGWRIWPGWSLAQRRGADVPYRPTSSGSSAADPGEGERWCATLPLTRVYGRALCL